MFVNADEQNTKVFVWMSAPSNITTTIRKGVIPGCGHTTMKVIMDLLLDPTTQFNLFVFSINPIR